MPGPAPKDPSVRQRRNKKTEEAELSAPAAGTVTIPELPKLEGVVWHPLAVQWWQDLWVSPMAPRFLSTDLNELLRAAIMVHDFWKAVTPDDRARLDAAITRQTSRFGLSNWDRNRMNWTVSAPPAEKPKPQSEVRTGTDDPRKVLQFK